jgi:hypothetical protein
LVPVDGIEPLTHALRMPIERQFAQASTNQLDKLVVRRFVEKCRSLAAVVPELYHARALQSGTVIIPAML